MEIKQEKERVVKRYVTITDVEVWELIDEIMKRQYYSKSFNKVFNEALRYGIVELYQQVVIDELPQQEEKMAVSEMLQKSKEDHVLEEYMLEVANLLKEILFNIIIDKNVDSQTHEMLRRLLHNEAVVNESVLRGYYSDTPKFMESYETRCLKKLQKK